MIPMRIGIAGVGKMGAAIGARLLEHGNSVYLWNRSPEKSRELVGRGAKVAATLGELVSKVDCVLTILTNGAAIEAVYGAPGGLLSKAVDGKLFVDMSTVSPTIEVDLAERVRAKGAVFIECPVVGTTIPASQGKLIALVGGEIADAALAKPVLEQFCRRLEYCGPVGSAALVKLAIQLPLMVYYQALGEALSICRPVGLPGDRIIDLLADTPGGPNILKLRGSVIAAALDGRDPSSVTFDITGAIKDLRLMMAEARARGLQIPITENTLACMEKAVSDGLEAQEASLHSIYWMRRNAAQEEKRE